MTQAMVFYQAVKNRAELSINNDYQKTLPALCSSTYIYKNLPSKHSLMVKVYTNAVECHATTMFTFAYFAFTYLLLHGELSFLRN